MTPRSASLRVAHQRDCANANKTAIDSLKGCTCKPSYYTLHRGRDGRPVKSKRVRDRRLADRALEQLLTDISEQRVGIVREKNISFPSWCDEFEKIVQQRIDAGELKPRTLREYRATLALAKDAIGHVAVREIGPAELRRFYYETLTSGPTTRAKNMRELASCLGAAVDEGYANANPVSTFMRKLKVRPPKRGKAPFDDAELARLWTGFGELETADKRPIEPVYRFVARVSVETGARLGELVALDWSAVNLSARTVEINATWNPTDGLRAPKDGEPRTVHLTDWAAAVLEEWVGIVGVHEDGPVFPNPAGGRLQLRSVQRNLARAMEKAAIPKLHPSLKLPRSFHSLRYTTSNLLQRRGFHPRLIEQTLGHGSLELTYGVYGGWTPEQLAAEAGRISRD